LVEPKRASLFMEAPQGVDIRIRMTIRMLLPAKKRKEALDILGSTMEQAKMEEGCLRCRLYRDVHEERAIMLEEIWGSEDYLERHLRSGQFRTVLLVVEMAVQSPEIRFDRVSHSTGISTIARARGELELGGGGSAPQPP
jgi:quinol monooxygenase YgiN